MAGLRRGAANAAAARNCQPCRNRRHTDCEQAAALAALADYREAGLDPADEPQVPFCACYCETDLHL